MFDKQKLARWVMMPLLEAVGPLFADECSLSDW